MTPYTIVSGIRSKNVGGGASKCWGVQNMLGGARMKLGGAHPPENPPVLRPPLVSNRQHFETPSPRLLTSYVYAPLLQRRRERYIIIHTWTTITGYIPNDLGIQFVESRRFGIHATVPSLKTPASSKAKACYENLFMSKLYSYETFFHYNKGL